MPCRMPLSCVVLSYLATCSTRALRCRALHCAARPELCVQTTQTSNVGCAEAHAKSLRHARARRRRLRRRHVVIPHPVDGTYGNVLKLERLVLQSLATFLQFFLALHAAPTAHARQPPLRAPPPQQQQQRGSSKACGQTLRCSCVLSPRDRSQGASTRMQASLQQAAAGVCRQRQTLPAAAAARSRSGQQVRRRALAAPKAAAGDKSPPRITVIASDVDGTLLNSQQQLTCGVEAAVRQAADAGVPLIVATGKARGPWLPQVAPRLGLQLPGVFLQGLLIADAQGNVLLSRCLPGDVVATCIHIAAQHGMTLAAYCGDRIFSAALDKHTDRLLWYKEPTPEAVGDLEAHLLGSSGSSNGNGSSNGSGASSSSSSSSSTKVDTHKLIFLAPQPVIDAVRPGVEAALAGRASTTTALSGMLEVLPLGASKGAGVAWLLDHLGLSADGLLALGDGENDIEMLQLAAVGVAMGNAGPKVQAVADAVVATNDEDGVAAALQRFVLAPRGLAVEA